MRCALRVALYFFCISGIVGLLGPARSQVQQTLTILHTSEHHGALLPIEQPDAQRGHGKFGGMAGRATLIAEVRREGNPVLLVDSGDILIGTALSSFFRGEPDIKAMNLMGYQAMAAGNHDFDFGLDHLARLRAQAQFPILCSNLVGRTTELPCQLAAVVRAGDLRIGLISLLGRSNFPDTFNREVVKLLELRDPIETARSQARALREKDKVDFVVAITHQGTEEDLALLTQAPEIDVIIGGHTEGFDGLRTAGAAAPVEELTNPGPVFVKTHRQGRTLGRLDLWIADKTGTEGDSPGSTSSRRIARARARNLAVSAAIGPDPVVNDLVSSYVKSLESQTATVIGKALVDLDGESSRIRSRETNLGNLLADLLRAEFGTEVALLNSGQVRDSIPAGSVDLKRVLQVLPFDSPIVTFAITGRELALALENSVSSLPRTAGRFLQVSGLTVSYDLSAPSGSRVREVTVGGKPLEPTRHYTVATDAFLADGGDGFIMFSTATNRIERQMPMRDLLLQTVRARPLTATVDGRIRFTNETGQPSSPPGGH